MKGSLEAMEAQKDIEREKQGENKKSLFTVEEVQLSHAPHEDIVYEVLLRLPSKSVLRFKAVCKSWRALILDPQFVKLHPSLPNYQVNYVHISHVHENGPSLSLISFDREVSEIKRVEIDSPCKHGIDPLKAWGSCKGLVLLGDGSDFFLWNPSTGEQKKLLSNFLVRSHRKASISGLGYDSSSNEYKAIIILVEYMYTDEGRVENSPTFMYMFSSRTGHWKEVDLDHDFPYCIYKTSYQGLTVNGDPHWIVSKSKKRVVVYFDMVDEKFKSLPTPVTWRWYDNDNYRVNNLAVFEECLCIVHDNPNFTDVWAMKEYGVKESWTKLFVIESLGDSFGCHIMPLGFSNNCDEVVMEVDRGRLVSYNLITKKDKVLMRLSDRFGFNVAYVKS